jgi:hypothetical protein
MREAEELWWFESGGVTVAFPAPRKTTLSYSMYLDVWELEADGRPYLIPMDAIIDRRISFPGFPNLGPRR